MLKNNLDISVKDPDNWLRPWLYKGSQYVPMMKTNDYRFSIFENAEYIVCVYQTQNGCGEYESQDSKYNTIISAWSKSEYIEYVYHTMFEDYNHRTKTYRDWSILNGAGETDKEHYLKTLYKGELDDNCSQIEFGLKCEALDCWKKLHKNEMTHDSVIQTLVKYVTDSLHKIACQTVDYVLLGKSMYDILRSLTTEQQAWNQL